MSPDSYSLAQDTPYLHKQQPPFVIQFANWKGIGAKEIVKHSSILCWHFYFSRNGFSSLKRNVKNGHRTRRRIYLPTKQGKHPEDVKHRELFRKKNGRFSNKLFPNSAVSIQIERASLYRDFSSHKRKKEYKRKRNGFMNRMAHGGTSCHEETIQRTYRSINQTSKQNVQVDKYLRTSSSSKTYWVLYIA